LPTFFYNLNIAVVGLSRTDDISPETEEKVMFFEDKSGGHFNKSLLFAKKYNSEKVSELEEPRKIQEGEEEGRRLR